MSERIEQVEDPDVNIFNIAMPGKNRLEIFKSIPLDDTEEKPKALPISDIHTAVQLPRGGVRKEATRCQGFLQRLLRANAPISCPHSPCT